jgi:kynurenine formamidase
LDGLELAGRAVLIETGHSDLWGTADYFNEHPYLTDDAVEFLVSVKPALVGIDSLNIDSTHTGRRPAHTWLLAARIPVVEHLTGLNQLPDTGFRFTAAPPAVRGMGTFPVRAFAVVG